MITDAVNSAFAAGWNNIQYYLTFQFLDPFWGWLALLAAMYVAVMIICYFFGTFWPFLRVIGGLMLLIATVGLVTYAKGERDARAHDQSRRPRPPAKPPGGW